MIALLLAAVLVPQQFSSLPLRDALQRAVSNSPDVAAARERVDENAALLAAARGGASPLLTANYAASPQAGSDNATVIQRIATVGAQFTLGDYAAYGPLVRQAAFTLASSQYDLLDAQRSERIKTIGEYFAALKALAVLQLREQDVRGARQDLAAAQIRYRAGDAPRLDVVRAQVALATAQSDFDAAQVDVQNAQDALAVETGIGIASFDALAPFEQNAPALADPARAVQRALAQRTDVLSSQQAIRAEEAAVAAARRGVLPSVTIAGGYAAGVDTGIPVHGPSANITVGVPLSGAAGARVQAEQARLEQARSRAAAIERRVSVEVAASARTYSETVRAQGAAQRARSAAQAELIATQTGYRSGASSSLDVANARRTYIEAAMNELSAMYARAQAAATLQEELGP